MILYMAVTPDEYELPMFVSSNFQEICEKYKVTKNSFFSSIKHNNSGARRGVKFVRVIICDE